MSPSVPLGTLESRYAQRLAEFRRAAEEAAAGLCDPDPAVRDAARRAQRHLEHAEVEYLLDTAPFIREYSSTTRVEDAEAAGVARARPAAGPLGNFVAVTHTSNRNNVLQRYMMHVENKVDATTLAAVVAHENGGRNHSDAQYTCQECDEAMIHHCREALLVCPRCGTCKPFTEMNAKNLTYEEEVQRDPITYFAYKRLNHFCEWLNSLQAKARPALFFCVLPVP